MGSNSDLVVIRVVQGELNGELIKSRLEAENIPVMLKFETYFNLQLGAFCPVSVVVPRQCADIAKKVIEPMTPDLISTIPAKNKWTFVLARLVSLLFGGR
jgi:hypothetical protein